jgi:hypothetical protein
MKYSERDAGKQTKFGANAKHQPAETFTRARLPLRVPRLRYRDSLRKNRLRAPLKQIYAESRVDASDPFRLSSFSTHSTKNT